MQTPLTGNRLTPDWVIDSYLEKPVQDEIKKVVENHNSSTSNFFTDNQSKLWSTTPESNKYVKPTDYFF